MFRQLLSWFAPVLALLLWAVIAPTPASAQHHGHGHHGHGHHGYGHHGYGHYGHGYHGYGHYGHGFHGSGFGLYLGFGHQPYGYRSYISPYRYGALTYRPRTYYYVDSDPAAVAPPPRVRESAPTTFGTSREGLSYQRRAEAEFRAGRYGQAARRAGHAVVEMPGNGKVILFSSQTLFAIGDYRAAAVAAHRGMSLLEPKDWGQVIKNYRRYYRGTDYVEQVRRLEEFVEANPEEAYGRFLLGYQYGFLGYQTAARDQLAKAVELDRRDELAARLRERFGGKAAPPTTAPDRAPSPPGKNSLPELKVLPDIGASGLLPPVIPREATRPLTSDLTVPTVVGRNANARQDRALAHAKASKPVATPKKTETPAPSQLPLGKTERQALAKLAPADRAAALAQRVCPVTGDVLGSEGTPIKIRVRGRDVFVCCEGCIQELRKEPEKYLAARAADPHD